MSRVKTLNYFKRFKGKNKNIRTYTGKVIYLIEFHALLKACNEERAKQAL